MRLYRWNELKVGVISWREFSHPQADREVWLRVEPEENSLLGISLKELLPTAYTRGYLKNFEEVATAYLRWRPSGLFRKEVKKAVQALHGFLEKGRGSRIAFKQKTGSYIHDMKAVGQAVISGKEIPSLIWVRRVPATGNLYKRPRVALVLDSSMGKVWKGKYLAETGGLLIALQRALSMNEFDFAAYTALRNMDTSEPLNVLMTEIVSAESRPALSQLIPFVSRELYRLSLLAALNKKENQSVVRELGIQKREGMYDFQSIDAHGALSAVCHLSHPQWIIAIGEVGKLQNNQNVNVLQLSEKTTLREGVCIISDWLSAK